MPQRVQQRSQRVAHASGNVSSPVQRSWERACLFEACPRSPRLREHGSRNVEDLDAVALATLQDPCWLLCNQGKSRPSSRALSVVSTRSGLTGSGSYDEAETAEHGSQALEDHVRTPSEGAAATAFEYTDSSSATEWESSAAGSSRVDPLQDHKVFVGGIPQEVGQVELREVFEQYGVVERAWLQRHRRDTLRNHRGFGFVIFHEEAAVDRLLGSEFSGFVELCDGSRMEVKRALVGGSASGKRGRQQADQPPVNQQAATPSTATPVRSSLAESADMSWQCMTSPGLQTPAGSWPPPSPAPPLTPVAAPLYGQLPQMVVLIPASWAGSPFAAPPPAEGGNRSQGHRPASTLEDTFQREVLKSLLIQAMPDHYED